MDNIKSNFAELAKNEGGIIELQKVFLSWKY